MELGPLANPCREEGVQHDDACGRATGRLVHARCDQALSLSPGGLLLDARVCNRIVSEIKGQGSRSYSR